MADAKTLARAIADRLRTPVIPPSHSSSDGLPENNVQLEAADERMLEAMALASGRVTVAELAQALREEPDA